MSRRKLEVSEFPDTPVPVRVPLEPPDPPEIELQADAISRPPSASIVWDPFMPIYDEVQPDLPSALDSTTDPIDVPVNLGKLLNSVFELFNMVKQLDTDSDPNFIECCIRHRALSREFKTKVSSIPDSHPMYANIYPARLKLEQCAEWLGRLERRERRIQSAPTESLHNVSTSPTITDTVASNLGSQRVSLDASNTQCCGNVVELVSNKLMEFQLSITSSLEKRLGAVDKGLNELSILTNESILPICHANSKGIQENKGGLHSVSQSVSLNTSRIVVCEQSLGDLSNRMELLTAKVVKLQGETRSPSVILGDHPPLSNEVLYPPVNRDLPRPIFSSFPKGNPPSYSTFEHVFESPPSVDNFDTPPRRESEWRVNGCTPLQPPSLPPPLQMIPRRM